MENWQKVSIIAMKLVPIDQEQKTGTIRNLTDVTTDDQRICGQDNKCDPPVQQKSYDE